MMSTDSVDDARDAASQKTEEALDTARAKAPKIADDAKSRARSAAGVAGRKMEDAAGRLRKNADRIPGGDRTSSLAEGVADTIESVGSKTRAQSNEGVGSRAVGFIKNNPIRVALAAGLVALTGIVVKRRSGDEAADEIAQEEDVR